VFRVLCVGCQLRSRPSQSYARRDRVVAMYAPVGLLALLATWMALTLAGYAGMYWALGGRSVGDAFQVSGSSLLTLGFLEPFDGPGVALALSEGLVGLVLLAMFFSYVRRIS